MSVKDNNLTGIEIFPYDEKWEKTFQSIEDVLKSNLGDLIICVEHVGSTSVKGLRAKPILDIDVVIEDYSVLPAVIKSLQKIGYYHQENWSFEGREAFGRKDKLVPWDGKNPNWMEHHLYVCNKDSTELARHLLFRNYLRNNPEAVAEYEQLKNDLAMTAKDRANYTESKTKFVTKILEKAIGNISS
ncbi:GrpB family protein [Peribacillus sp. NPDC096379]|uniref:GrpB family protein n=1 Tax=Peribacillus sp. NPDC096379 TaxID=3364393 RepID=UPI0037FE3C50